MRQLSQDYRSGVFHLEEVPSPIASAGQVVVKTEASAVSVGTEKQTVDLAKRSLIGKALARPDLVRQVIAKVKAEGLGPAWRASKARLDMPVALGYSAAGVVTSIGPGVTSIRVGDRVACVGSGHAGHAEQIGAPERLVVPILQGVSTEEASFAAIGGIALHAARLAKCRPGDPVVVIGLGLLGQIAVQVLRAWGARVFAIDISTARVALAKHHGAEEGHAGPSDATLADRIRAWSGRDGARAVLILAATPTNGPLELAAECCGNKGRIIAAGLVGLDVPRKPFFEKELELVVSRGWGHGSLPGQGKMALPESEVTARDTISDFLALLAKREVSLDRIITHRFPFERALDAYDLILHNREPFMGIVLKYDGAPTSATRFDIPRGETDTPTGDRLRVGMIGAGSFARA